MKKVILLIIGLSFISCEDIFRDDDDLYPETESVDINVTIKNSQTYYYDLGEFGINEGAEIDSKGEHFDISELNRDDSGRIIYRYRPQSDYVGDDFVAIVTGSNYSDGIVFKQETFIRLFIEVVE